MAGALLRLHLDVLGLRDAPRVGVHDLLASQAYLNIVQFVDRRLFRMAW